MKTKLKKVIDVKNSISTTILGKEIPLQLIEEYKKRSTRKFRNRIYSLDMIMYGMLYQAMSEDKSEQNTVLHIVEYYKQIKQDYENQKERALNRKKKKIKHGKIGRPKSELPKIQRSKLKDISLNTGSYDEAKQRMPLELVKEIFEYGAKDFKAGVDKNENTWNGLSVYATDGTTFKTQDTEQLRKYFDAPAGKIPPPVPMGRMQGLINIYMVAV